MQEKNCGLILYIKDKRSYSVADSYREAKRDARSSLTFVLLNVLDQGLIRQILYFLPFFSLQSFQHEFREVTSSQIFMYSLKS